MTRNVTLPRSKPKTRETQGRSAMEPLTEFDEAGHLHTTNA